MAGRGLDLPAFRYFDLGMMATYRTQPCGGRNRIAQRGWLRRLAAVVRGAYIFPDRFQEPSLGGDELDVELRDLSARYAANHRDVGIAYGQPLIDGPNTAPVFPGQHSSGQVSDRKHPTHVTEMTSTTGSLKAYTSRYVQRRSIRFTMQGCLTR